MQTAFDELTYQVVAVATTGLITIISYYLRNLINTKIEVEKYGLSKEKLNTLLSEAVLFAEQKGKEFANQNSELMSGDKKLQNAKTYINKIDPNVIREYGDALNDMIASKVAETFGTSLKNR